ncbi:MAG: hypothetical protein ABL986_23935 [Vicinamibacterales bacterium]
MSARLLSRLAQRLTGRSVKQIQSTRDTVATMRALTEGLTETAEAIAASQKQMAKILAMQSAGEKDHRQMRGQMSALVRAAHLRVELPSPLDVHAQRFSLLSEHEEDGVILALLQRTGVGTRTFVEIGRAGNAATLARDMGWRGLVINTGYYRRDRTDHFRDTDTVIIRQAVDAATINDVLSEHGYGGQVDLLSMQVRDNEYWLLRALTAFRARVLVIEYNANFGPTRAVTVPQTRPAGPAPEQYFGASLAALEREARSLGYRLILCDSQGINAFFVRNDLAPDLPGQTARDAYRPHRFRARGTNQPPTPEDTFQLLERAQLPLVTV